MKNTLLSTLSVTYSTDNWGLMNKAMTHKPYNTCNWTVLLNFSPTVWVIGIFWRKQKLFVFTVKFDRCQDIVMYFCYPKVDNPNVVLLERDEQLLTSQNNRLGVLTRGCKINSYKRRGGLTPGCCMIINGELMTNLLYQCSLFSVPQFSFRNVAGRTVLGRIKVRDVPA